VSGQQHAPAALYPRERRGTHCTGGWVGLRAGLDGRKISSPPGFDPGLSSPHLCIRTHSEITAELPLSGLTVTASRLVMQKIRTIGFFFESRIHWRF